MSARVARFTVSLAIVIAWVVLALPPAFLSSILAAAAGVPSSGPGKYELPRSNTRIRI